MEMEDLAKQMLERNDFLILEKMLTVLKSDNSVSIYNKFENIINDTCCISTYEEYLDFLDNDSGLNKNVLICQYLKYEMKLLEVGGFEDDIAERLIRFINAETKLNLQANDVFECYRRETGCNQNSVFIDYDGEDNFFDFIAFLKNAYLGKEHGIIVFFNDIYCQCAYHVAVINNGSIENIKRTWSDNDISIIYSL